MPSSKYQSKKNKHTREIVPSVNSKSNGLIIIGCSTGGPSALQAILPKFPKDFTLPILVIQHMPKGFTKPLANRLHSLCSLPVKEVDLNGEPLVGGQVYIAPAGFQTIVRMKESKPYLKVIPYSPIPTLYNPSIDVTLLSAAPVFKEKLVTAILTGMGHDGLLGCKEVRGLNGKIIVEAEETCVVYGMPRVILEEGLADEQVGIHDMYESIVDQTKIQALSKQA
ncbi:MAG: CheB methylesterase domain-containing protein [Bacillaceae bacterium]|nr:CheB methylesterase domain-containing protein [Bacillaceae bacterium]